MPPLAITFDTLEFDTDTVPIQLTEYQLGELKAAASLSRGASLQMMVGAVRGLVSERGWTEFLRGFSARLEREASL